MSRYLRRDKAEAGSGKTQGQKSFTVLFTVLFRSEKLKLRNGAALSGAVLFPPPPPNDYFLQYFSLHFGNEIQSQALIIQIVRAFLLSLCLPLRVLFCLDHPLIVAVLFHGTSRNTVLEIP